MSLIGLMPTALVFCWCATNLELETAAPHDNFCRSEVQAWDSYILCSGSYQAEFEGTAGAVVSSEIWGPPPGSLVVSRMTEVLIFLLAVCWGSLSAPRGHFQVLTTGLSHNLTTSSKPAGEPLQLTGVSHIRLPDYRIDYMPKPCGLRELIMCQGTLGKWLWSQKGAKLHKPQGLVKCFSFSCI